MQFNSFSIIFLIAIFSYIATMLWLNYRQNKILTKSYNKVPAEFKQKITIKEHQKATKYTKAKLARSNFEIIFSSIILLLWTIAGGLNYIDSLWQGGKYSNTIHAGVGFAISIIIISIVISMPFAIYHTFVLEEKFGFNKTTAKTFINDLLKTLILTLVIGTLLCYIILYLMQMTGDFWWFYVWLVLSTFSCLMLWLYPAYIAPIFNKFKKLDNLELVVKINNLLNRTGFKSNGVFVMDGSKRSSHGNAYFTGIGKNKRIVFFDTLLKNMSANEIEAILAHELGHFHHKHIKKRLFSSFTISLLSLALLGYLIDKPWFFNGLGVATPSEHTALVLFALILPIFTFLGAPISNYLSRKHEFEADSFAAKHTSADNLISSLVKLYKENAATLITDHIYSIFHDSHPPASVRINQLKNNN